MTRLFPGIDPFIEAQNYWPGFHNALITYCRDALAEHLPDAYDIWIEERIELVGHTSDEVKLVRPDVAVDRLPGYSAVEHGLAVLEIEPTTVPFTLLEQVREAYLRILHRPERTLVTVLELLSPENKAASGSSQYLAKRNKLFQGSANLVELDFLIGGNRLPMARPLPPGHAYAIVARGDRRPDCEVYAWSIRQALTKIRVPLLAPDPDVVLDLAAVYATTFEKGRYARAIDYTKPPTLGLSPEDRAWAEARAKGLDR